MAINQDVTLWEIITPEIVLILGLSLTLATVLICLFIGYKHKTYEALNNVSVLARIAVFSVLGFILSFVQIPMPVVTHISLHLFPAFMLAMGYGPFVGGIAGLITGSKGFFNIWRLDRSSFERVFLYYYRYICNLCKCRKAPTTYVHDFHEYPHNNMDIRNVAYVVRVFCFSCSDASYYKSCFIDDKQFLIWCNS